MTDKNNKLIANWTYGVGIDDPLVMTKYDNNGSAVNYFYHSDHLGSIIYITNENGKIVESYEYKTYGKPIIKNTQGEIIPESILGNPFMFTAREYDYETGLYFYRARYYDAEISRFIQEDPIGFSGGDTNLYTYVKNNPVRYKDPNGTIVFPVTGIILSAYFTYGLIRNSTFKETCEGFILTVPPPLTWNPIFPIPWGFKIFMPYDFKEWNIHNVITPLYLTTNGITNDWNMAIISQKEDLFQI